MLGVLYGLVKTMSARTTSKWAGSEVRGESREKGILIETIPKPRIPQRVEGILFSDLFRIGFGTVQGGTDREEGTSTTIASSKMCVGP